MKQDPPHTDAPSRSRRKRDALALQRLGEALAGLPAGRLESLGVPDDLREALAVARTTTRGAHRRQVRYIGKLLRSLDAEVVERLRDAVEGLGAARHEEAARHRRLERWRERLIAEGDAALEALVGEHPDLDRTRLRRLVREARSEIERERPPRAQRALFAFLRDLGPG